MSNARPWIPAPPSRRTADKTGIRTGQQICEQVSWLRFVVAALTGRLAP